MTDVFCDAVARMKFFSAAEGGLNAVLAPSLDRLGCLFRVDGDLFDCFVLASKTRPGPGVTGDTAIVFLMPEIVKSRVKLGSRVVLQHATPFAEGEIVDLPWMSDYTVNTPIELYASVKILKKRLDEHAHREPALGLERALSIGGSNDEILNELRNRLLALPKTGICEEPEVKWRIDRAIRYIESRLNAWPSTAVR